MIKAIGAEQDNPPRESLRSELAAAAEPAASGEPAVGPELVEGVESSSSDVPFLTYEEKRRILARIARVNATDCFDESGAFDIARAKRILPPGAIRHIAIHETTRLNAEGQPVTERRINVRLVDPVSALRLDDQLERRRERTASSSTSDPAPDPDAPPPHPASPEYAHMLLRQNTKGLDEALHTLALLKKALAEKKDRQLQLSKELDEKDRQLSKTLSKVEGDATQRDTGCQPVQKIQSRDQSQEAGFSTPLSRKSNPLSNVEGYATQRDTGCQPVQKIQSRDQSREAGFSTPLSEISNPLSNVEGDARSLALQSRDQSNTLSTAEQPTQFDTISQPVSPEPEFVGQALRLPEFPNTPEPGITTDAKNLRPIRPSPQRDTGCQPVQKKPEPSTSLRTPSNHASPPIPSKSPTHPTWAKTPPPPTKSPRPPRPPPSPLQPVPRRHVSPSGMLTVTEF